MAIHLINWSASRVHTTSLEFGGRTWCSLWVSSGSWTFPFSCPVSLTPNAFGEWSRMKTGMEMWWQVVSFSFLQCRAQWRKSISALLWMWSKCICTFMYMSWEVCRWAKQCHEPSVLFFQPHDQESTQKNILVFSNHGFSTIKQWDF